MPALAYSVADFTPFTKIRSADVNSKFTDIKTLLNTTGLDDTNLQAAGITRATKLKTGTAGALVVNNASTGAMNDLGVGTAGFNLNSAGTAALPIWVPKDGDSKNNYALAAAVASSALTVSMKGADGNALSATNPVVLGFRSATAATGTPSLVRAITVSDVVVPNGATLGHTAAIAEFVYVYAINNAGTIELAVSGSSTFLESQTYNTSAIGTGSDSKDVLYSTSARTGVAIRYLGKLKVTEAVAGVWDTAPSLLSLGWGEAPALISSWVKYTVDIISDGTDPAKGGTITFDQGWWRRVGSDMEIVYRYRQTSAGTSGTGNYGWKLPAGFTPDTNFLTATPQAHGFIGYGYVEGSGNNRIAAATLGSMDGFHVVSLQTSDGGATVSASVAPIGDAARGYAFSVKIPISGWEV